MRIERTDEEKREAARQQVALLISACLRFDDGEQLEYLTIASKLRVLVRHTSKSHAVFAQVGLLDRPIYVASGADLTPENVLPESALTYTRIAFADESETRWFFPRLDDLGETPPKRMLPLNIQIHRMTHKTVVRGGGRGRSFEEWWSQPIIRDMQRESFSRREVILKVANQDGGDHVDPSLDARHYSLTRLNSMGMYSGQDPFESPVPATIRQIGWEVHSALWEHDRDLLGLVPSPEPPSQEFAQGGSVPEVP